MATLSIKSKTRIFIGSSALNNLNKFLSKNKYQSYFILCDENTFKHCLPLLISNCANLSKAQVFEIEPGESSKVLEVASQIWNTLIESKAGKDALIINLGGGVVCDLGGFCASVFKRGIDYVNIPTSLLAMADASVGSKTAIDFNGIKNALGSFYEPMAVFIEPLFLLTLPNREIRNGLAEIVKMALINDKKLWLQLNNPETNVDETLIKKAIDIKTKIVQQDPFDNGIRKSLNYGHSIGHAIESIGFSSKLDILHGEAIVIGMIIENHIAYQLKMLNKPEMELINNFLKRSFKPQKIKESSYQSILVSLDNDKKNSGSKWKFVLLNKIGACKINLEVKPMQIKKALQYYTKLIE